MTMTASSRTITHSTICTGLLCRNFTTFSRGLKRHRDAIIINSLAPGHYQQLQTSSCHSESVNQKIRLHRTKRTKLNWPELIGSYIKRKLVMCTIQRHVTSTYFVLIGCRHSKLCRIVCELEFANRSWCAVKVPISMHVFRTLVQLRSCDTNRERQFIFEY